MLGTQNSITNFRDDLMFEMDDLNEESQENYDSELDSEYDEEDNSDVYQLQPNCFYRYIEPSAIFPGLNAFYGQDRSYCLGQVFDTGDLIVEFSFRENQSGDMPDCVMIPHHKNSFRGSISEKDVFITGIFYQKNPLFVSKAQLKKHLGLILNDPSLNLGVDIYEVDEFIDERQVTLSSHRVN